MIFVTVVLSSDEWLQISQAAHVNWPAEPLDRQVSRNEVCRRFCLAGVSKLSGRTNGERRELTWLRADELEPLNTGWRALFN